MYLLYVADAVKVTYPVVKILQYADDVVLYLKTSDFDLGKPLLENAVIQVSENLQKIGLKVFPGKDWICTF